MAELFRKRIRDGIRDRLVASPDVVALVGKTRQGEPRIYSGNAPALRDAEDFPALVVTVAGGPSSDAPGHGIQVREQEWDVGITLIESAARLDIADRLDALALPVQRALPRTSPRYGEIIGLPLTGWSFAGEGALEFFDGDHGAIGTSQIRYRAAAHVLDADPARSPHES